MASRLRVVVDKVASLSQHASVHGHQILDASLIFNKCINYYLRTNQSEFFASLT